MNYFVYKIKTNIIPFIIAVILLGACCAAWFFYHPASPYHMRYSFVVRYESIGTLSPGNRVEIRGLTKGKITKVELTDDAVYVTAEVLADAKIPKNSEFRLINSGLMGEREMCVLTGDSSVYISDGDTLNGNFDEGTAGVTKNIKVVFENLSMIKAQLVDLKDSVVNGSIGNLSKRVVGKSKNLTRVTKTTVECWKGDIEGIMDKCGEGLQDARSLLKMSSVRGDSAVQSIKEMVVRYETLVEKLKVSKSEIDKAMVKLESEGNSVGLILSDQSPLLKEMDNILRNIDALMGDIRKSGAKLNVDIF